jgi:hypothetical protein
MRVARRQTKPLSCSQFDPRHIICAVDLMDTDHTHSISKLAASQDHMGTTIQKPKKQLSTLQITPNPYEAPIGGPPPLPMADQRVYVVNNQDDRAATFPYTSIYPFSFRSTQVGLSVCQQSRNGDLPLGLAFSDIDEGRLAVQNNWTPSPIGDTVLPTNSNQYWSDCGPPHSPLPSHPTPDILFPASTRPVCLENLGGARYNPSMQPTSSLSTPTYVSYTSLDTFPWIFWFNDTRVEAIFAVICSRADVPGQGQAQVKPHIQTGRVNGQTRPETGRCLGACMFKLSRFRRRRVILEFTSYSV